MKQVTFKYLLNFTTALMCFTFNLNAQHNTDISKQLSKKEKNIIVIAAYAARGNMPKLTTALHAGLDAGLSINETKEILVHLYAYAGFPRSLNALNNLMAVVNERKKSGMADARGREPSALPTRKTMLQTGTENQTKLTGIKIGGGVYEFAPAIDQFLKEHLFGAIFSRDNLDWKTRELVTIAILASMDGTEMQLRSHFGVGMHNGLAAEQLTALVTIIEGIVSQQRGTIAKQVLQSVLDQKTYTPMLYTEESVFPKGEKIANDNFTGIAFLQPLIAADSLHPAAVGHVTFEPGARTKWHLHPGGQILLVIDGVGYYQEKGQPKRILRKGDAVKCPPNLPHWHGASPDAGFVQLAITNNAKGATVWLEKVTDEVYNSMHH